MNTVSFEKLSGSTKLFLDFIQCSDAACKFFKYDFRSVSSYINAAEWIDRCEYDRPRLVEIIKDNIKQYKLTPQIENNLEKLAKPDSLIVFTGQQVGMLLGPMYTVIKALSAYKLANVLEEKLNRPVVPCFWMASDDHDFDEVKTVKMLDRSGEIIESIYEPINNPGGSPMADVVIDDSIDTFISSVNNGLIETEFSNNVKNIISKHYVKGTTLSNAFAGLFIELMGGYGIIPVDPNFSGMKELFTPVFKNEIENHEEIFNLYETVSNNIIESGYHRQVHKTKESLNLFLNDGGRSNIIKENDHFKLQDSEKSFSKSELLILLENDPDKFSSNVCLRPIAQCFAFPTIAQIVGPSEAAYFAQIGQLFNHFNVPWPVVTPRKFVSIMEPHIKKIFDKLDIDYASLYNDTEHEISRVIKEKFPSEIQSRADSIQTEIDKLLVDLSNELKEYEPISYQAMEHSRKKIDHEMNKLSKKLFATHKKRHDTAKGQIEKASAFLFPNGIFHERVLSPIYFLNKFGPDIIRKIESELDIDSIDHQIVEL